MTKKKSEKKKDFFELDIDDQVLLINEVLSEQVYPSLEMDGGGMEIMDIENSDVLIRYYGACGACPISESGTLIFIQNTLREKVDPRIQVKIV